ncbi:methionyl-tRNA formyltransferase [Sphingomonas qomolangmaensis]|uniref:Methionyl-tRNA formyltransferase n=1 Tax=Sphingomonas qomolangmaensis TaxID=2918765 RepID=A0ABY5L9R8_9SPHN|nr:methionyl-tRNA formyltransferase [Sphingomonas qomolangmaensis]UUL83517.1 methionyl-tRNA formyltransferase [Sphingomonas qomolangmaensis]
MRIVFMGTPEFAVPILDAVVAAGHEVVAAYTQPPRRAGRGKALTPSPVQASAEARGIAVHHPVSLRDAAAQAVFAGHGADVAVVAAYGLILPRAVLDAPRHGCLNVHASLLPRWRGAAPIQRAILAGDAETGVGIMQMEAGLDTGPVRLEGRTPVDGKTAGALTAELSAMGARLMVEVLADLAGYPPVAQAEGATHAPKIDKAEARLDFSLRAVEVERQVRAFNPAPGAFFEVGGERVRVLQASVIPAQAGIEGAEVIAGAEALATLDSPFCGNDEVGAVIDHAPGFAVACAEGYLVPTLIQRAGRGAMTPAELLRGFPIPVGTILA